jgi:ligand-binding sensor domain-containing protein
MVRRIPALCLALSVCALPALATTGADAPPAMRYALAAWSNEQSGDVFAIAQDLDGYLWLGTPDGLVRFDGTRFQPWAQSSRGALPVRPVSALAGSSQGGVWVAYNGGGGVARIDRGGITQYSPDDGAPSSVNALLEDRRGTVWAATGHGLFRYAGNRWSRVTEADGYDGEQAFSVYEDRAGRVGRRAASIVTTHRCASSTARPYVDSLRKTMRATCGSRTARARQKLTRRAPALRPTHPPAAAGWRIISTRGGLLVASFSGGLFRLGIRQARTAARPVEYEDRMRGSPGRSSRSTTTSGSACAAACCASREHVPIGGPARLSQQDGVRTAAARDGSIWITTQALNRLVGPNRQSFAISQTRSPRRSLGRVWVATDEFVGCHTMGRLIKERIPGIRRVE